MPKFKALVKLPEDTFVLAGCGQTGTNKFWEWRVAHRFRQPCGGGRALFLLVCHSLRLIHHPQSCRICPLPADAALAGKFGATCLAMDVKHQ
eukprot:scaffold246902_cov43-Prasinocladus_malaysianus.AAC.6